MKRLPLFLLALALALPGIPAQHRSKKPVSQLRAELRKLREKKQHVKAELKKTKRQAQAVVSDIHAVDSRLSSLSDSLADTEDRLDESRREQRRTAEELVETSKKLDETREQVRLRLKRMYMQGDSNLLTAFARSESVGDIASRQVLFEKIATKDRQMFNDYTRLKREVAAHKVRVDTLVQRIANLKDSERQQQASLQDARQEKRGYLRELQGRVGELQELVDQFQADEESITSQIQSYDSSGSRSPMPAFTGRFSKPVNARITSGFGMRYHPILHITRLHAGIDFGASYGTPIHAAADGVVISAQQMRGYGNVVIIDHGGYISTVYAHCSRIMAYVGEHVKRGQVIAAVGATGLATGPHLHFEVRVHGHPVNPLSRL